MHLGYCFTMLYQRLQQLISGISLMCFVLLTGCSTMLASGSVPASTSPLSEAQARLSASHYLRLANSADSPDKQADELSAVRVLMQANLMDEGDTILQRIDDSALPSELNVMKQMLAAHISLSRDKPQLAVQQLTSIQAQITAMPMQTQRDYYHVLANAALQATQPVVSVRARIALSNVLDSDAARQENNEKIAHLLQTLTPQRLAILADESSDPILSAWAKLTVLANTSTNFAVLTQQLANWQADYPGHPANQFILKEIDKITADDLPLPEQAQQIALLLPLSGKLAISGQAIQNGFLTAYYNTVHTDGKNVRIKVYDTAATNTDQGTNILTLYQQAVADGADIVVGPLLKTNVQVLVEHNALRVPTIALNTLDKQPTSFSFFSSTATQIYQFGLSPRDEAAQAADKAFRDGKHRALVFAPNTPWGEGVSDTFEKTWEAHGAKTLQTIFYDENTHLADAIKTAFNVDQSNARHRALDRNLAIKTKTIPRRRQDVDMVFLAANPKIARQMMPLFKFYYAGDIPVYATSFVYSGKPDRQADKDINGILFCDMPFLLDKQVSYQQSLHQLQTLWPNNYQQAARLYALGLDAYALTWQLNQLAILPLFAVQGATGMLSVQSDQRIHRDLNWAQVRHAQPVMIVA